jgi:hypothetical protein
LFSTRLDDVIVPTVNLPPQPAQRYSLSVHEVYSSPEQDVIARHVKALPELYIDACTRYDALVQAARPCFPDVSESEKLVVSLVERCRQLNHVTTLGKRIRALEAENARYAAAPRHPKFGGRGLAARLELVHVRRDLARAANRITALHESIEGLENATGRTSFEFEDEVDIVKVEYQVQLTKERAELQALITEVAALEMRLSLLEKRIGLLTQRKSAYASLFSEHPEHPAVVDRMDDLLRRCFDQPNEI